MEFPGRSMPRIDSISLTRVAKNYLLLLLQRMVLPAISRSIESNVLFI